jgi:hypothetical protein
LFLFGQKCYNTSDKQPRLDLKMETRSILSMRQEQQQRSLFLFVVVAGYIVPFTGASNGGTQYFVTQLLPGLIFGVIYLSLGFFEAEVLQPFSTNQRKILYLSTRITHVFGIGCLLDSGGNWLIGLLLATIAVGRRSYRSRTIQPEVQCS